MKISVVGSGYVGLVTGAGLAKLGHNVLCVDIDQKKVDFINRKVPPFYEKGLKELLEEVVPRRLTATTDLRNAVLNTEITFIGVGTPSSQNGHVDLRHIRCAAQSIGEALSGKKGYHVVVVKSTVPPGTTENVVGKTVERFSHKKVGKEIGLVMSPEFLREGEAIYDFFHPTRIIIGSEDERATEKVRVAYSMNAPVVVKPIRVAEMIKYSSNAFLATKITFANEIGRVCKAYRIDVYDVMDAIGMDERIGRQFLNAGPGFGGSCLPKDVKALRIASKRAKVRTRMMDAVMTINREQPLILVDIAKRIAGNLRGKKVCVLGLAFKSHTDDVRESQAIPLIKELLRKGAAVTAYDPEAQKNMQRIFPTIGYAGSAPDAVKNAEIVIVLTDWPSFKDPLLYKDRIVIDSRHIVDPKWCRVYEGIAW